MTRRCAASASVAACVGWLCLACSLAEVWCASAQMDLSHPTEVTPISVDRQKAYSQDDLIASCRADSHCTLIETDGSGPDPPPLFLRAVTNDAIATIVLTADRYTLKRSYWDQFRDMPYVLKRNLTVLSSVVPYGVLDFSLMQRRVQLSSGVAVAFRSIVLQNIRKLGGWAVDFFVGEAGSQITLQNVVRVKPACQLPTTTLTSAASFQRVSPAYPPNNVTLLDRYCVDAAISGPTVMHNCYDNVLHFVAFSNLAANDDPSLGRQYPGYVLFQENTSRVCQATITQQCLDQNNGDEDLCLVMLIAATLNNQGSGGVIWTPGAIAGVAIAASVVLIGVLLLVYFRKHILLWCLKRSGKSLQEIQLDNNKNSREWALQHAVSVALGHVDGPATNDCNDNSALDSGPGGERRAISQQVTLGVLLGAGSFGRVYRGRWHSTDVAVKIMACTPEELPKVLREAEVMMQLNHRNVIRAFHASVWNPQEQVRALKARERRGSGSHLPSPDGTHQGPRRNPSTLLGFHNNSGQHAQSSGQNLQPSSRVTTPTAAAQQQASIVTSSSTHAAAGQHGHSVLNIVPQIPNPTGGSWQNNPPGYRQPETLYNYAATSKQDTAELWYADRADSQSASFTQRPLHTPGVYANGITGVAGRVHSQDSSQALRGPSTASYAALPASSSRSGHYLVNSTKGNSAEMIEGPSVKGFQLGLVASMQRASAVGEAREPPGENQRRSQPQLHQLSPVASPFAGQQQPGQHPPAVDSANSTSLQQGASSSGGDRSFTTLAKGIMGPSAAAAPAGSFSVPAVTGAASGVDVTAHAIGIPGMAILHTEPDGYHVSSNSTDKTKSKSRRSYGSHPNSKSEWNGEAGQEIKRVEAQVWIVLELCTGGTLKDAVAAGKLGVSNRMETGKLLSRLLDTAKGMAYLHSKGIMHGDLKACNVLLQNLHGEGDQVAKISDFGLATVLLNGATHRSTASMGTITHMAPEVLRSGHVSCAADVYSFAILLWEVLTNQQAYHGVHYGAVVERVVVQGERPPIPDNIPDGFSILLQTCWDAVPEKRPTFDQIVTCLELMLDNLSDIDSSNATIHSASVDEEYPPLADHNSMSGIVAVAAANHLQPGQEGPTQRPALPALAPGAIAALANVSPASIQQQPATPRHGQQHPAMNGISRVRRDSSTQHSTHCESRGSRSVSQGYAVDPNMQVVLHANPFVQDL